MFFWSSLAFSMTQSVQFSSVQLLSHVRLSIDHSTPDLPVQHKLPKFTQTHVHQVGDAIQPSHPLLSLLLLPSIFPSIRVFSNESTLRVRWPKYWSFSFSISSSKEHPGLIDLIKASSPHLCSLDLPMFHQSLPIQTAGFCYFQINPCYW